MNEQPPLLKMTRSPRTRKQASSSRKTSRNGGELWQQLDPPRLRRSARVTNFNHPYRFYMAPLKFRDAGTRREWCHYNPDRKKISKFDLPQCYDLNAEFTAESIANYGGRGCASYVESGPAIDALVDKFTAEGLNREAVARIVPIYGDNITRVKKFADGFTRLHEMGFPTDCVQEALFMYDLDIDKAAHFIKKRMICEEASCMYV